MLNNVKYYLTHILALFVYISELPKLLREGLPGVGEYQSIVFAALFVLLPIVLFHITLFIMSPKRYVNDKRWGKVELKLFFKTSIPALAFIFAFLIHFNYIEVDVPAFEYRSYQSVGNEHYSGLVLRHAYLFNVLLFLLLILSTALATCTLCFISIGRLLSLTHLVFEIDLGWRRIPTGGRVVFAIYSLLIVLIILILAPMGISLPINMSLFLIPQCLIVHLLAMLVTSIHSHSQPSPKRIYMNH
ncbi:hypothetical protein ACPV5V_19495 [Vibrio campbellii]